MDEEDDTMHTLHGRTTAAGYLVWCRCGKWEGWFSGPDSQALVLDDHDHHRRTANNGASLPPVQ
jgi:hypothetical protein